MAKKKKAPVEEEEDDVPDGKSDEDGDEIIDLYEDKDDLTDDIIYEIPEDDEMIADETEAEELGYEISEVEKMLRKMKCEPCSGSDSKRECTVRDDFECPPGKESKKQPWTDSERRSSGKKKKK